MRVKLKCHIESSGSQENICCTKQGCKVFSSGVHMSYKCALCEQDSLTCSALCHATELR